MLVTLGALDADPQKCIGKINRPRLWSSEVTPGPIERHRVHISHRLPVVTPHGRAHFVTKFAIALSFPAALCSHHTSDQLVVRRVVGHALENPIKPGLTGNISLSLHGGQDVVKLLIVVAGKITEQGRPPGNVTGTFK